MHDCYVVSVLCTVFCGMCMCMVSMLDPAVARGSVLCLHRERLPTMPCGQSFCPNHHVHPGRSWHAMNSVRGEQLQQLQVPTGSQQDKCMKSKK